MRRIATTLLCLLAGCSSAASPNQDAGSVPDAGTTLDARVTPDAGTSIDAGTSADSGATVDAGHDAAAPDLDAGPGPEVTFASGPGVAGASAVTADATPTFTFTTMRASSIQCRVDGAAPGDCASMTFTTSELAVGAHTFEVRVSDGTREATASVTFSVAPPRAFEAYIKASNAEANDFFGELALSADGNTLAVSAIAESGSGTGVNPTSDEAASHAGAVYVYRRVGDVWVFEAYIKASNTQAEDNFGQSLALSADGNTLVVGAYLEDGGGTGVSPPSDEAAENSGAAYVYTRTASTWSFQAYIKATNTGRGDRFGTAVSLSSDGNTLAVSADSESGSGHGVGPTPDDSLVFSGAVYLYRRTAGVWASEAYVKAEYPGFADYFGNAIALSGDGNTLVVGVEAEDGSGSGVNPPVNELASQSGAVFVYRRSAGAWAFDAYIKASNTDADDNFGTAIAVSADGNTLAVGASGERGSGMLVNPADDDAANDSGAAYVYTRATGTWAFQAYVKAPNTEAFDAFGTGVALSAGGDVLAVGATFEGGSGTGINPTVDEATVGAGAAYVYMRNSGAWGYGSYVKATNPGRNDNFGSFLALSGDGTRLAVGAPYEDGAGRGVSPVVDEGAETAGAVYVYH